MAKKEVKTVTVNDLVVPDDIQDTTAKQAVTILDQARLITITDDAQYAVASSFLTTVVNPALRQLDEAFDPIVKRWHEGHKTTLATKKKLAEPFVEAKRIIDGAMSTFQMELRRKQLEVQAGIERALKEEAERVAIEKALELMDSGDEEGAVELLGVEPQPLVSVPVVVRSTKVEGSSFRVLKRFRVVDVDKVSREYMVPDEKKIQEVVNRLGKGAEKVVGGIEMFEVGSVASTAK